MKINLYVVVPVEDDEGFTTFQVWDLITHDSHFESNLLEVAEDKCNELNKLLHQDKDPHYKLRLRGANEFIFEETT